MAPIRRYLSGEHPRRAAATVVAVGLATAGILGPFGLLEIGISGQLGEIAFALAFGVLPGLAGVVCGWYRFGFPAALGSGVASGVAFYLVVTIGAALSVGSFGGGDSPLGPFALLLTAPSVASSTVGFTLGNLQAEQAEFLGA